MEFILYSDINERSISSNLGVPEYSYFFVLKAYRRALETFASVHCVQAEEEIAPLQARLAEEGKTCVVLVFAPPHKAPIDLPCQTLCVVAWEYDSIPDTAWDDEPRHDWRYVFARHGAVITLSSHTQRAVKAAMGEDFPVLVLPAPLWEQFESQRQTGRRTPVCEPTTLEIRGSIIDTRLLGLSADGLIAPILEPAAPEATAVEPVAVEPEAVAPPELTLGRRWLISKHYLRLWYREAASDLLPRRVALALGQWRAARRLAPATVEPPPPLPEARPEAPPESEEHPQAILPATDQLVSTPIEGVVYTSVFNPDDGRKNWEQLVTAFCWAFRDTEDATLVLKITQRDLSVYYVRMLTLLSQLSPFKCRVLVLHGFLEDEQFGRLFSATSFYVNFSRCEGLCLPLMEFLACGKPALAPAHTAMADYVDDSLALVIPAGHEHSVWPQDSRILYRTLRHRPDWGALMRAYQDSYRIARQQPARYETMSQAALARMRSYADTARFQAQLSAFVQRADSPAAAARPAAYAGNI
ncbi:glycosyltransferase [Pseudomonas sp. PDM19]|uniref:glycosyltransferase n=1 Tax=Pseudomonas sp. PDM19 TaxID=2769272 RepID=UPI00177D89BF|nr:glycosyltransferase [Pseudomonas sp. PDM19]MBD9634220.1 glycosyltransferase [Pseudomonas sp. PDM19]